MTPPNESGNSLNEPGQFKMLPFQGDKIYVGIDALFTIGGFAFMFAMAPTLAQESLRQQASAGGPKVDPAMIQNIFYGMLGCSAVVCIPITIFLWVFMLKNKNWAFIVGLVLAILGLLNGVYSLATSPVIAIGIFSAVSSLARSVYLGGRVAGKIGPKPA